MREAIWQLNLLCHTVVVVALAITPMHSVPGASPDSELDVSWTPDEVESPVVQEEVDILVPQGHLSPSAAATNNLDADVKPPSVRSHSLVMSVDLMLGGGIDLGPKARVGDRIEFTIHLTNRTRQVLKNVQVEVKSHSALKPLQASDDFKIRRDTRAIAWTKSEIKDGDGQTYQVVFKCVAVADNAPVTVAVDGAEFETHVRILPAAAP